jgi:hypothetical protein
VTGGKIRDPVFNLERVGAGKRNHRRVAPSSSQHARAVRRQTSNRIVAHEFFQGQVPRTEDILDLFLVAGLVGKLRHPHHGSGIIRIECRTCGKGVESFAGKGSSVYFDQKTHSIIPHARNASSKSLINHR